MYSSIKISQKVSRFLIGAILAFAALGVTATMPVAASLAGATPSAAYAAAGDVAWTSSADMLGCKTGSTLDLSKYFAATVEGQESHLDYIIADGTTGASVNKHSGAFVATESGTYSVTVYLLDGAQPTQNPGKPCTGFTQLDTRTVTITASDSSGYGLQGTGFQIQVLNVAVASVAKSGTTYTNYFGTLPAGTEMTLQISQNAGLNQYTNFYATWGYDSPEAAYKALAGQYITFNGETLAEATDMDVVEVNSTSGYVVISLPALTAPSGKLTFSSDLHTFKQSDITQVNKTLGNDINFTMDAKAAKPSLTADCPAAEKGEKATVTTTLTGADTATYRFYYSVDDGATWTQAAKNTTGTATVTANATNASRQWKVVATTADGQTAEAAFAVSILEPTVTATVTPAASYGAKATVSATVDGYGVYGPAKYKYYYSADGGVTWVQAAYHTRAYWDTDTQTVTGNGTNVKRMWKVVVTFKDGRTAEASFEVSYLK